MPTENTPFQDTINTMLPPKTYNGKKHSARVTTSSNGERQDYYAWREKGMHKGADINYHHPSGAPVGQNGINLTNPKVHSPVSGTVTDIDRKGYGTIEITDDQGYTHRLMHLKDIDPSLEKGDRVFAGLELGAMGGRGPNGNNHYDQHLHYTILSPDDKAIDPERFWNDKAERPFSLTDTKTIDSSRAEVLDPADQPEMTLSGESLRREGEKVYRIEPDGRTRGFFVSE